MKNCLRIDFENSQLIMDRAFEKKAMNPASQEYEQLQQVRKDYPMFRVVRRTIRRNPKKETYAGLTYTYMENYILGHEAADTVEAVLEEYRELRLISQCHGKGRRYPAIKKWFLAKYPAVAEFGMEKQDQDVPAAETGASFEEVIPPMEQKKGSDYSDAA